MSCSNCRELEEMIQLKDDYMEEDEEKIQRLESQLERERELSKDSMEMLLAFERSLQLDIKLVKQMNKHLTTKARETKAKRSRL